MKSGLNLPLKCKKCGHVVGNVRIKPRLRWKMIGTALGLAFLFEVLANIMIYLIVK
jgi:hypothetical protein